MNDSIGSAGSSGSRSSSTNSLDDWDETSSRQRVDSTDIPSFLKKPTKELTDRRSTTEHLVNQDYIPLNNSQEKIKEIDRSSLGIHNEIDLVEELAKEKEQKIKEEAFKTRMYQVIILAVAFTLSYFNRWRQEYVLLLPKCVLNRSTMSQICNNVIYSANISSALGFIVIGNCYDNLQKPRYLVLSLLVTLSITSLIEAIFLTFPDKVTEDLTGESMYTLYQMSSICEAGITVACIVTLHNWFEQSLIGIVSAILLTSNNLQKFTQIEIYNKYNLQMISTLCWESYTVFGVYMLFSVICWFFFYHHPNERELTIKEKKTDSRTGSEVSQQNWQIQQSSEHNLMQSDQFDIITPRYTRYAVLNEVQDPTKNLEVTLLDALRIKEINLLVLSFLIRETHNRYIMVDQQAYNNEDFSKTYYQLGGVIGLLMTGIISDIALKNRRFLLLFIFNMLLVGWDLYIFFDKTSIQSQSQIRFFSMFLGCFTTSSDLLYLILIPLMIAKQMQNDVGAVSQQQVCFAGTIVGVVLALSFVGKQLISYNLATMLYFATGGCKKYAQDLLVLALIFCSNLVLWTPIKDDLKETALWKCCCLRERVTDLDEDNPEIADIQMQIKY